MSARQTSAKVRPISTPLIFSARSRHWLTLLSLRAQLTGTILLVLGAGLGLLLIIAGAQMSNMTYQAFSNEQQARAYVLAGALTEPIEHQPDTLATTWIDRIRQVAGPDTNISVVNLTGKVLVNSNSAVPTAVDAPEIQAALHGLLTSTIHEDRLYVAMPIFHNPDTQLLGVLWLDAGLGPTNESLRDRWLALILATLGTLALGALAAWQLEAHIVNPLSALQTAAGQMAEGTLSARVSDNASRGAATEIAELAKAFNHMADQIETTIARQREFVANASHELRAPLAALKLRAESLMSGAVSDPAEVQQYAAEIDSETGQLAHLVLHLLQLTRAEDSTFRSPVEAIDPAAVLHDAIRAIRPRLAVRQQHFTSELTADLPDVWLQSDDLRIIVNNLLDNAIKYTPDQGTITLLARVLPDQQLYIEVRDSGIGIPPGDLPRVTERFFRVDRAHSSEANGAQPGGTGLGLAITAALVRRYGGTLTLSSSGVSGEGTTARLWLPITNRAQSGG